MNGIKFSLASGVFFLLLAPLSTGAISAPGTDESTARDKSNVYSPEIKPSITSLEVARSNLAELLSGKNEDVPGMKVPTMPDTCREIDTQSLGEGGPSHASVACRDGHAVYAIYANIPVTTTSIRASNKVSVNFSDLVGSDLSVKEIPADQSQLHSLIGDPGTYPPPPLDGRPDSRDVSSRSYQIVLKNGASFHFKKLENAATFADNLLFIQSMITETESAREARFEAKLARYRAGDKPPVTEEQRRLLVQANFLTQRKNYSQAIDLYLQALDIDPVAYPDAYFNCALLAAEMERYPMAIDFMKKYLLLLPDGKDARQAQDKIYEWELMATKR